VTRDHRCAAAAPLGVLALLLALTAPGCASDDSGGGSGGDDDLKEAAINVLTFQSGTISELRDLRGTGPFTLYEQPPEAMLDILRRAAGRAVGLGGRRVQAIFVSRRYGEVIAKEREAELAGDDSYEPPFRSAMVATVHAIPGEPNTCRVEIHATDRGPFHKGRVEWERDMPRWIDQVLVEEEVKPVR
jgi:hypothetical protein